MDTYWNKFLSLTIRLFHLYGSQNKRSKPDSVAEKQGTLRVVLNETPVTLNIQFQKRPNFT